MNKTISAVMAAVALAVGGAALAQDGGAECQGSGRCGYQGNAVPRADGSLNNPALVMGDEGWAQFQRQQQQRLGAPGYYNTWPYAAQQYPYAYRSPYERTQRDRDGDGVRNSRDRYPDDPRYR